MLKIDIEGYEAKAFRFSDVLFDKVFIAFIIMEFATLQERPAAEVEPLLGWLQDRGYQAFNIKTLQLLQMYRWTD